MTSVAEKLRSRRVGLSLASGFFGFYHHAGVLLALVESGIKPLRIAGNSAGALVGSMYAAGLEPRDILGSLVGLKRSDFWDTTWPFARGGFGLLAGQKFRAELARVLPVHSFAECKVPLSAGAYEVDTGRTRHLADGSLVAAVYASCAVPYLFSPIEVDGVRLSDGGFAEKTPLVPFLHDEDVDVVIISYLEHRGSRSPTKRENLLSFMPPLSSFFADIPFEERLERDWAGARLLRQAGKDVVVLAPERLALGPFSMHRGREAAQQGHKGALELLAEKDLSRFGALYLSQQGTRLFET